MWSPPLVEQPIVRRTAFPTKEAGEEWVGKRRLAALAKYGFKLERVPAKKVWLSRSKRQVIFVPAIR